MTRVLVTGASGFVGQGLLPRLAAAGYEVRAATRRASNLSVETVMVGEIGPDTEWGEALSGVDAVIHLAARVHVTREEAADPLAQFRRVNQAGTARLADAAERASVKRFVLASSVKAAAETSDDHALRETDPPMPRTPYGISKWEGEQALRAAARRMETVVLRPPLVYGPGVGANFRTLMRLVDSGMPLPLAAVRNRRSLIARDNLADALLLALSAPGIDGGTFYVTDGAAISTPDLIRSLGDALGRPARLFAMPPGLLLSLGRLVGRKEAAESVLGSLEVDDTDFRVRAGWRPPLAQADALRAVAAAWKDAR